MKFLHTADWQIGMKAAHAGKAGPAVRDARFEAARKVVDEGRRRGAEFILVAGDTFEDNGVDRVSVRKVVDILASFGGPVYVIPGNHDPWVPGSVWEHPAWKDSDHVRVLLEPSPVAIPGGVLYPCPVTEKHSTRDPTAWIRADGDKGIRIGLAHGTVEAIHRDEPEYPIPADAAQRTGLDYLALGHWHSTVLYEDSSRAVRMAYSGTPEPTGFGERASGRCLLVEIAGPGEVPRIEEIQTGSLAWIEMSEEIRERGDVARIRDRLQRVVDPGRTLVSLCLRGVLDPEEEPELASVRDILEARLLHWRLDDSALMPAPQDERWIEAIPAGYLREAARRLLAWSAPGRNEPPLPQGFSPEAAARALRIFYSLSREAAR